MGLLEEVTKKNVVTGVAVGLGVSVILPRLLPILAEAAKPLAKGVMKSGLLCYEKSREIIEEVGETTEDLWAEVKSEMEEKHMADLENDIENFDETDN